MMLTTFLFRIRGKYLRKILLLGLSPFAVFRKAKNTEPLAAIREFSEDFAPKLEASRISGLPATTICSFRLELFAGMTGPNAEKTCFLINFADRELSCEVELSGRAGETRICCAEKFIPESNLSDFRPIRDKGVFLPLNHILKSAPRSHTIFVER